MSKPIQSEYEAQCGIIAWSKVFQAKYPELKYLNASLSGVKLSIGLARKMKRAGMVPGVPDLSLPVVRLPYHGLYIELKRKKGGRVSEAQKEWLEHLTKQGYCACVCRGKSAAIKVILGYLGR